jgi:CubicO group peptidase (beta-lactamase class C family)
MRTLAMLTTVVAMPALFSIPGCSCSPDGDRTPSSATAAVDPRLAQVRELVVEEVASGATPSLSLAVALDGEVLWEEAFGLADKANGTPATPHTMYHLGSIAKPMTATAVMQLAEAGLVDLDAPIERYLGGLTLHYRVASPEDVTVRRVLQHRAGLPPHNQLFFLDEEPEGRPLHETVRRYGQILFDPGQSFIYSNLGYQLLARAVEQVSGIPFPRYMRERVFAPLGMSDTEVYTRDALPSRAALSYFGINGEQVPQNTSAYFGNGDVYCSAHDLLRFALFHLENRLPDQRGVLTDSTIESMQRQEPPDNTQYGLGWWFDVDELGLRLVYHGGQTTGVSTLLVMTPSHNLAYVILANTDYDAERLLRIHRAIRAALISGYGDAHLAGSDSARIEADAPAPDEPPAPQLSEGMVGEWQGQIVAYDREIELTLVLDSEGGAIAKLAGQGEQPIDLSYASDSFLLGTFVGSIPTPDIALYNHSVRLALVRTGTTLSGQATAVGWREDRQTECELSSWIELSRQ